MAAGYLFAGNAFADSYIEQITTPPSEPVYQEEPAEQLPSPAYPYPLPAAQPAAPLPTVSPVVMPPYQKYAAWQRAEANKNVRDEFYDGWQNLIYFTEGAFLGIIAYDIWGPYHRHHLLNRL